MRASAKEQWPLVIALCAMSAACAVEHHDQQDTVLAETPGLIEYTPTYSAYDGVHDYKVTAQLSRAALELGVDPSTVRWTVDDKYVMRENAEQLPAGLLLTMKKPGATRLTAIMTTLDGEMKRGATTLSISQADPNEWQLGDDIYERGRRPRASGQMVDLFRCGTAVDWGVIDPPACANCHRTDSGGLTLPPSHVAALSDEQLILMFTQAVRPPNTPFSSPILRMAPNPECLFKAFHTWTMTEQDQRGLVWKLRSLEPGRF